MIKGKKYQYFNVRIRKAEQILELQTLEEFVQYTVANNINQILKTSDFESLEPCFALASKGALYLCSACGFEKLEDYVDSVENGFPDAASFYEARSKNCTTYNEYQVALSTGITDAALFDEIKKEGYLEGYMMFDALRHEKTSLPRLEQITNVKELFDFAKKKSFENFQHFLKVWEAGFTDPVLHQSAVEKGLNNSTDFEAFKAGKFNSIEEFSKAKQLEIKTRDELVQYYDLDEGNYPQATFDERLLLDIISKFDNGSKTAFDKLYAYFVKTEESYKRPNGNGELKLPKWYTKRRRKENDVKEFLVSSDFVKRFGTFDAEKQVFETVHIQRRKVVVDGSNVAHNSNMVNRRNGVFTAELKNILLLVKKLKEDYKFEDIHVISDFSLHAKAKDKYMLREIKELCRYSEAPQGTAADLYLINQVKKHHCLLITNDTFSDWKLREKWVEDNIDFYTLRFMLNDGKVVLPHMERFGS